MDKPTESMEQGWEKCHYCKMRADNHGRNTGYRCKRHRQQVTIKKVKLYTEEQVNKVRQEALAEQAHDHEILVNTILEEKKRLIEEVEKWAKDEGEFSDTENEQIYLADLLSYLQSLKK